MSFHHVARRPDADRQAGDYWKKAEETKFAWRGDDRQQRDDVGERHPEATHLVEYGVAAGRRLLVVFRHFRSLVDGHASVLYPTEDGLSRVVFGGCSDTASV